MANRAMGLPQPTAATCGEEYSVSSFGQKQVNKENGSMRDDVLPADVRRKLDE